MPAALDLELIRTFLSVIEARGFKPAAAQMNKTPAAVSQQIKRLEDILGKRILERSNQGISLTSAGEVLKAKGQRLMALNYELLGELRDHELSGQLSFGAPTDYAPTLLQKILPLFQREFPQLSPTISLEPSRMLRPRVNAGSLDMAIVAQEIGKTEGIALWSEDIAWFGTALNHDGTPRVGVLGADCILRDQALAGLTALTGGFDLVLESAAVASLKDAVEAGFCQAFLPISISDGLIQSTSIKAEPLTLTFSLITGSHFDPTIAERVSDNFGRTLRD